MADPDAIPPKAASTAGAWHTGFLVATTAVLLFTATAHMFFVVPTYRSLMTSVGTEFSVPARLAVSISRFGLLILVAGFAGLAVARRKERNGAVGAFSAALALVALCAAIYLTLVSTIYLDFARIVDRLH